MTEEGDLRNILPARDPDSHKGSFGRLAIVAGSSGKAGAAVLSARGALRAGAGLVTVFCPASIAATIVGALPEVMTYSLPESSGALSGEGARELLSALSDFDAVIAGPGPTTEPGAVAIVEKLLEVPNPSPLRRRRPECLFRAAPALRAAPRVHGAHAPSGRGRPASRDYHPGGRAESARRRGANLPSGPRGGALEGRFER